MSIEEEKEEVGFLDVTLYNDETAKIEFNNNKNMAKVIASAIINDDELFKLFSEVLILCHIKMNKKINLNN